MLMAAVVVLTIDSCGIYGKYKPQMSEEEQLAIKVPSFRDIFMDPDLLSLIDTALTNNYDLKMAHERVHQADLQLTAAKLAYLPRIFAGGSPMATIGPSTSLNFSDISYSFGTASWSIDIFGRTTNAKRIAKAYKEQLEDFEQASRSELVAAVSTLYFTLQMLDAQILATDAAEANWASSVEAIRAMKEAGLEDEAGVSQFEGSYFATRANAKTLRLLRDVTENSMRLLLCSDDCPIDRGFISPAGKVLNVSAIESIDLNAVRVRPDVRAAEMQLAQSFYNVNLARANCCPDITIGGNVGWASGNLLYSLVGGLLQPVFNAGANIIQVKVSKSQLEEYQMAYANTLLNAGTEVNNALASIKSYKDQVEDYSSRVDAMKRALDATQLKMKYGRGTYLEVLTAQNNLLDAQMQNIQNNADILTSMVDLFLALGGCR